MPNTAVHPDPLGRLRCALRHPSDAPRNQFTLRPSPAISGLQSLELQAQQQLIFSLAVAAAIGAARPARPDRLPCLVTAGEVRAEPAGRGAYTKPGSDTAPDRTGCHRLTASRFVDRPTGSIQRSRSGQAAASAFLKIMVSLVPDEPL